MADLDSMTRDELNAYAAEHGVADPESYANKDELRAEIDAVPAADRPTSMQDAAAEQEAGKPYTRAGAEDGQFVVYQAGSPYPPPSGNPNNLWTEDEWDAADPTLNLFRVEGTKVTRQEQS